MKKTLLMAALLLGLKIGAAPIYYNSFTTTNDWGALNLATNIVFDGGGFGTIIIASSITGTGQVTKQGGAFNVVLQGSNYFAGPVVVNTSGTLTPMADAIGRSLAPARTHMPMRVRMMMT